MKPKAVIIWHVTNEEHVPIKFGQFEFAQSADAALLRVVTRTGEPATVDAAIRDPDLYYVIASSRQWYTISLEGSPVPVVKLEPVIHLSHHTAMRRSAMAVALDRLDLAMDTVDRGIGRARGRQMDAGETTEPGEDERQVAMWDVAETSTEHTDPEPPDPTWPELRAILHVLAHVEAAADFYE